MTKTMQYKKPVNITWSDILIQFPEGSDWVRYEAEDISGIRHAISRRIKFTHPTMSFETKVKDGKIYVRRLSDEITQQQPSVVGAGQ